LARFDTVWFSVRLPCWGKTSETSLEKLISSNSTGKSNVTDFDFFSTIPGLEVDGASSKPETYSSFSDCSITSVLSLLTSLVFSMVLGVSGVSFGVDTNVGVAASSSIKGLSPTVSIECAT
jgi:hypothetical protein